MPRAHPLQSAFNAGEFTPLLVGRVDFAKYPAAGALVENLLPLAEGGLARRPGTRFIAEVKNTTALTLIRRFLFDTEQAYAVEWGDGYCRFYRHQGRIAVAATEASITNGTFETDIAGWTDQSTGAGAIGHDAANGRLDLTPGGATAADIAIAGQAVAIAQTGQEHVLRFRVFGLAGDGIQLRVGSTPGGTDLLAETACPVGFHCCAFTPTGAAAHLQFRARGEDQNKTLQIDDVGLLDGQPLELETPYGEAVLRAVRSRQTGDIEYITHGTRAPHKLERRGHTTWSLVEVDFEDGPYLDENTTPTTLQAAAASGPGITVTASATVGINDGRGFLETDIGRPLRLQNGTAWAWGKIAAVPSATQVAVDHRGGADFPAGAQTAWRLGAWSATTGYPQLVDFVEQRAVYGPTASARQTIWFTQSANLENLTPDNRDDANDGAVEADDAFDYRLPSASTILWIKVGKQLALGTLGQEWIATSDGPILTPDDIQIRPHTGVAGARIEPVVVDNVVLFVSRGRRRLHEFAYVFESDGYRAPDMTLLASHLTVGGILEMAHQQEPDGVVWIPCAGGLRTMTYKREQDVIGWARQRLGGAHDGGPPAVESVTVLPGDDGAGQVADSTARDEVWMIVKRTIGGQTRQYVEMLEERFEGPQPADQADTESFRAAMIEAQKHAYYADSLLTYDGPAATEIGGLDHLEGEMVAILADGAVHPPRTVSGGAVILDSPAGVVQVGLPYTHRWMSLKNPAGAAAGTGVGKIGRIHGLTLVLHESAPFEIGASFETMSTVAFRRLGAAMDTAVPLFTGEYFVEVDGPYDRDSRLCLRGSAPAPFTLLALAPEQEKNEMV